ncbi:interleukin-1 receptor-like 2 isoform X2 [Gopherus flavomarginatus]|uniref:interleukin-1 receptor-like 2 isoform X2 n=1 Tax=Gopherus flavomarginatus TaxID=286002 RepID=UPI0021CC2F9A|nr:interleukin-1 receptor-like 2 isoform X2 [Gopherus flavomarginatus]
MAAAVFTYSVILVFLSSVKAEECQVHDVLHSQNLISVLVGEPLTIDCLLHKILALQHMNYSLTWYKSGRKMPVTQVKLSRIHQHENLLWFMPALLEDSGSYECVMWNLTSCNKIYFSITVFKNTAGLCFNGDFLYAQEISASSNEKIVCPHLDYFRDEKNTLPIHWYKECNLIDNERFLSWDDDLIINSANVNDSGNYSCKMTYTYMEKEYNISRNIYVTVIGSNVIVDCNVSSSKDNSIGISWRVNNTLVNFLFMGRVQEGNQEDSFPDGYLFSTVTLNITEVKQEDYGHQFVCHAGEVAAYIALRQPVRNFLGYLIGGLIAPMFVIIVAILIYKYFKVDIVLWYRKSCRPFLSKEVSDGKIYDAYVLYPKINKVDCIYTPDNFVLKLLPQVLERQYGYNLFILGRDDLPGKAVVNVVDETIKQSRRLIIVLVPESSNCSLLEDIFEQQLAVYNALVRDGIKVILIELDKIKDYANMPESIKYIKQKHGAIRWKGDFTEKSHSANTKFWKNVRYQMPPRCPTFSELHLLPTALNTFQTTER